jgi:ribonuclease D
MTETSETEGAAPQLFRGDLPVEVARAIAASGSVAIDTETLGLNLQRDRLCLVQMATADGATCFVKFEAGQPYDAPNLAALLTDPKVVKLFHFGRFDIAKLHQHLGALTQPVYCTKIASKLVRTYTEYHGLKNLVRELLGVELNKQAQTSDWGAPDLSPDQLSYAANDVIYLHGLRERLDALLAREGRLPLLQACLDFLPHRALLDVAGWDETDIFAH